MILRNNYVMILHNNYVMIIRNNYVMIYCNNNVIKLHNNYVIMTFLGIATNNKSFGNNAPMGPSELDPRWSQLQSNRWNMIHLL